MRHFILLLAILSIIGCGDGSGDTDTIDISDTDNFDIYESGIYEGDYTINNQRDIIFISKCKSITGNLVIEDTSLTNLEGLENLTAINGNLLIYSNDKLVNLVGLNNLISIGGRLDIERNDSMTSLDGLDNLISIEYHLDIIGNNSIISLNGLSKISKLSWVDISENKLLEDLEGLDNLTSVVNLAITHNDSLVSLNGLNNLTSVKRSLVIAYNNSLPNFKGLGHLEIIASDGPYEVIVIDLDGNRSVETHYPGLFICNNEQLTSIQGIYVLYVIRGKVVIRGNPLLPLSPIEDYFNRIAVDSTIEIRSDGSYYD